MALSGDEIRRRLGEFASRLGGYQGSERAGAQTFLDELLRCHGTDRLEIGATFETLTPGGFVDMLWPGRCTVEMKRPSETHRLESHRRQVLDYWIQSGRPGPRAPEMLPAAVAPASQNSASAPATERCYVRFGDGMSSCRQIARTSTRSTSR